MLHVMDPSSRTVLYGDSATGEVAGVRTDGFRFVVQSFDPQDPSRQGARLPNAADEIRTWQWQPWQEPAWYAEVKPAFATMQAVFAALLEAPRYLNGTRPATLSEPKR